MGVGGWVDEGTEVECRMLGMSVEGTKVQADGILPSLGGSGRYLLWTCGRLDGFSLLGPSKRMELDRMEGSRIRLVPDRLQNDARSGALLLQRARDGGGGGRPGTGSVHVHLLYMACTAAPCPSMYGHVPSMHTCTL